MKNVITAAVLAIALGASAISANAQSDQDRVLDIVNGSGLVDIK